MWIPQAVMDMFHISKQTVDNQREDLAAVRMERDGLRAQLATSQANFDWLRVRVNTLEVERAQLLEKAYGIRIPVPEIARTVAKPLELGTDIFEDVGERVAKDLGLPSYASPFASN